MRFELHKPKLSRSWNSSPSRALHLYLNLSWFQLLFRSYWVTLCRETLMLHYDVVLHNNLIFLVCVVVTFIIRLSDTCTHTRAHHILVLGLFQVCSETRICSTFVFLFRLGKSWLKNIKFWFWNKEYLTEVIYVVFSHILYIFIFHLSLLSDRKSPIYNLLKKWV